MNSMVNLITTIGQSAPDEGSMFLVGTDNAGLLELAARTAIMFAFALLMVRLTGKRSLGQLSPFDFVIIIALGSAVGDPMLYRDVALADAAVVIVIVVALNLMISKATSRSRTLEKWTDSTASVLIRDGVVDAEILQTENLSRVELGEALRLGGIVSLSEVRLAVLEPSGGVSILTATEVTEADDTDLWSRFLEPGHDDTWS